MTDTRRTWDHLEAAYPSGLDALRALNRLVEAATEVRHLPGYDDHAPLLLEIMDVAGTLLGIEPEQSPPQEEPEAWDFTGFDVTRTGELWAARARYIDALACGGSIGATEEWHEARRELRELIEEGRP